MTQRQETAMMNYAGVSGFLAARLFMLSIDSSIPESVRQRIKELEQSLEFAWENKYEKVLSNKEVAERRLIEE